MARPGGDLDTTLNLNRACNIALPPSNIVLNNPGMIYDSPNPQISSFGKRRKYRFGQDLYQQMGPTPITNNMLYDKYLGGGQNEPVKPYKIDNPKLFIDKSPVYDVLQSVTSFGLKNKNVVKLVKPKNKVKKVKHKKKRVIKPGDTLSISPNGKIKVSSKS
jgi:hypothetical protein